MGSGAILSGEMRRVTLREAAQTAEFRINGNVVESGVGPWCASVPKRLTRRNQPEGVLTVKRRLAALAVAVSVFASAPAAAPVLDGSPVTPSIATAKHALRATNTP